MNSTPPSSSESSDTASELARLRAALAHERESRSRLELALQASGEGFWEWLPGPDKLFLSATLARRLGLPDDGRLFPGADYLTRIHPDDASGVRNMLADLLRNDRRGETVEHRFRIRDADGDYCWTRVRAVA